MRQSWVAIVFACVVMAPSSLSQITIETGPPEPEVKQSSSKIGDLPKLLKQVEERKDYWKARKELLQLASNREHEEAVVSGVLSLLEKERDLELTESCYSLVSEISRRSTTSVYYYDETMEALQEIRLQHKRLVQILDSAKLSADVAATTKSTLEAMELKIKAVEKVAAQQRDALAGKNQEVSFDFELGDGTIVTVEPMEGGSAKPDAKGETPTKDQPKKEEPKKEEPKKDQAFAPPSDLRRVAWVRPFEAALKEARESNRVLLVKPIMGGSNTPDPNGVPCGGKRDLEGSW